MMFDGSKKSPVQTRSELWLWTMKKRLLISALIFTKNDKSATSVVRSKR